MRQPAAGEAAPGSASPSPRRSPSRRGPSQPVVFQVPLRWAVVGVLGAAVVLVMAYGIGVMRGRSLASSGAPAVAAPTVEVQQPKPQGGSPAIPATLKANVATKSEGAATAPVGRQGTDNNGDPRVKGWRYYVIMHPSGEKAPSVVDFCRANGLDAYLVPDDTAMFRKIIVLPGYKDPADRNNPEIKALEAAIKRVGAKYKTQAHGSTDFSDAYPEICR